MTREQREQHRRRKMTALWFHWELCHPEMTRGEVRRAIQMDLKLSPVTTYSRRPRKSR